MDYPEIALEDLREIVQDLRGRGSSGGSAANGGKNHACGSGSRQSCRCQEEGKVRTGKSSPTVPSA